MNEGRPKRNIKPVVRYSPDEIPEDDFDAPELRKTVLKKKKVMDDDTNSENSLGSAASAFSEFSLKKAKKDDYVKDATVVTDDDASESDYHTSEDEKAEFPESEVEDEDEDEATDDEEEIDKLLEADDEDDEPFDEDEDEDEEDEYDEEDDVHLSHCSRLTGYENLPSEEEEFEGFSDDGVSDTEEDLKLSPIKLKIPVQIPRQITEIPCDIKPIEIVDDKALLESFAESCFSKSILDESTDNANTGFPNP